MRYEASHFLITPSPSVDDGTEGSQGGDPGGMATMAAAGAVYDDESDSQPQPDGPNEQDDGKPSRPKAGRSSANDAVSAGISGLNIAFDANRSSSTTKSFSYGELKRPFDPAQWGDGYQDETYSDFQHRESESHISLGVGGDSTHFELGWSSSGNTDSSVETDNYSLGRYMYEDDYMEMWDRISYSNVSDFSNEFNIGFGDVEDAGIVNESSFNVSIKDEVESHIDYDGWFSTVTETFIYRDSSDDEKHETQDTDSDSQPVTEMQNPDDDTGPEEDDSSPIHLHKTTYAENDSVEVIIHFEGVPGQGDDTGDTQDSSDTDGPTTLPDGPNDEDSTESDDTDAPDGETHQELLNALIDLLPDPTLSGTHTCSNTADDYCEALAALPVDNGLFTDYERVSYLIDDVKMPFPGILPWIYVYSGLTTGHAAVSVDLVDGSTVIIDNGALSGTIVTGIDDVPPWYVPNPGPPKPILSDPPWLRPIRPLSDGTIRPNRPWWGPHGKF